MRSCAACSFSVCICVCVCVLRGYSHLLECWSVSTGCFFSVNTFGRMSFYIVKEQDSYSFKESTEGLM